MSLVRTLVVADETPWPRDTGYRQRLSGVLDGLAAAGPVSWVTFTPDPAAVPAPPPGLVADADAVPAPWLPRAARLLRAAAGPGPRWVAGRDWAPARAALPGLLARAPYDLVWFAHLEGWAGLGDLVPGPQVVDLDNLMSVVMRRRASTAARVARPVMALDAARWARLEERAARGAARLVVCSDVDAQRLGGRAVVVPNGYAPSGPVPARRPVAPPVLLLVASFDYPPNADAASWFARDVLPLVRRTVPDARLRLVGRTGGAHDVTELAGLAGVEVVGRVDDVAPELAGATAVVAPLLSGGGTRIKVLEAFAYGVPVAATSVGAEGLDAVPGRHLLVGDDPGSLARACVTLLTDPGTGERLAAEAARLHHDRFRWEAVVPTVTRLAQDVAGSRG